MYTVVRKLNENAYEEFNTYETKEEAIREAKVIEQFLGYKNMYIIED